MLVAVVLGMFPAVVGVFSPAAVAVPGVPDAPTVIYSEDFENAPDSGDPQLLTDYVSTSPQYPGGTYTADPFWASYARCNGFVVSSGNTFPAGSCGGEASFNSVRGMAPFLGTIGGTPTSTNSVVAANTAGLPGTAGQIEFATVSPISLPTPSRFLTFSVDALAKNCETTAPLLQFYVKNSDGSETALGGVINPCSTTDPRTTFESGNARGGRYPASGSFIASGSSVGIVMRNNNGGTTGNDGAFDNIQLLDATPQLDKSFATPDPITGVSTLTFTVTNTSDLATKLGWGATDTLSAGLVVANPSNASTTCTNGTITAPAGGDSIIFEGDLDGDTAHLTSCTFTVDVVPSTPTVQGAPAQVFQNCAANLTGITGLNPPACATVAFPPVAQLSVAKSSTSAMTTRQGDVVNYAVTVTNTGGSDYTAAAPATMTDDLSAVLDDATYNNDATATGPDTPVFASPTLSWSGPLAVGASVTVTYSMTVTLAGDAVLTNTACVPAGQASAAPCATVSTPIVRAPAIDLVKSASPLTVTVGTPITYTFVATNTGNVDLTNPTVTEDAFNGANPAGMTAPDCGTPAPTVLAPGEQMTCTATYDPVQADVDGGALENTATATGTPSTGPAVVSPPRTVILPAVQDPSISIVKSAGPGGFTTAGQTVTYSFLATNTGNVTLTNVNVVEGSFSGSGTMTAPACPAAAASMAPGAQVTCTATYLLTQTDVDAGSVTNTATSTGTPPSGPEVVSDPDDAIVTIDPAPSIAVQKSAAGGPFTHAGQVVDYSFLVTNTGNVTLAGIVITEIAFSGTGTVSTPVCPVSTLAPAGTTTCTASYTLTQTDVDARVVTNTATSHGTPPSGPPVDSIPSDAVIPITPAAAIALLKSVDRGVVSGAGERVTYSFLVTNTGESTLTDLTLAETTFTGTGTLPAPTCPVITLAPNASTTCISSYQITSTDATARQVDNTATVTGTDPTGGTITSDPSSATVTITPALVGLATTGATITIGALITALGLIAAGLTAFILRWSAARRSRTSTP